MTDTDFINLITIEVGTGLDSADLPNLSSTNLGTVINTIWNLYAYKRYWPKLQYLYTKQHVLNTVLGQLRIKIDKSLGPISKQMKQYFDNCTVLYDNCGKEIEATEREAAANRDPDVDKFKMPKHFRPSHDPRNPNNPRHRGADMHYHGDIEGDD